MSHPLRQVFCGKTKFRIKVRLPDSPEPGSWGGWSGERSVTRNCPPPAKPKAAPKKDGRIELTWAKRTKNTGFDIQRQSYQAGDLIPGSWGVWSTVKENVDGAKTEISASGGISYRHRIRSRHGSAANVSSWSGHVTTHYFEPMRETTAPRSCNVQTPLESHSKIATHQATLAGIPVSVTHTGRLDIFGLSRMYASEEGTLWRWCMFARVGSGSIPGATTSTWSATILDETPQDNCSNCAGGETQSRVISANTAITDSHPSVVYASSNHAFQMRDWSQTLSIQINTDRGME